MRMLVRTAPTVVSCALLATLLVAPATAGTSVRPAHHPGTPTERVNISSSERQADAGEEDPATAIDRSGRYVTFSSAATNLVAHDTNGTTDVFVRDRERGTTTRVSVSSGGLQGDADSGFSVAISASGRFVAFLSNARTLVRQPPGAPDRTHVLVRDRHRHTTEQVDVATDGRTADASASFPLAISATGRHVAFVSAATNLATGESDGEQVYLRDRKRHTTSRVSVTEEGRPFPDGVSTFDASLSGDARFVAFSAGDAVYVRDRRRGATERVAEGRQPELSATGRFLAFQSCASDVVPDDVNGQCDVFLRDRRDGTTSLVSVSSCGEQSDGGSYVPHLSPGGRYVGFSSDASNLVRGDTNEGRDVFVRDTRRGRTARVSVGFRGQAEGGQEAPVSFGGSLSGRGRYVTYWSSATNLVPGDTNEVTDVFVTRVRAVLRPS